MIMRVLNTERTANRVKDLRMTNLEDTLTNLRDANEGRAAWIGKERVLTLKAVGADPGRPSLANDEEDEEDEDEDDPEQEDDDLELDFGDDVENQDIGTGGAHMNV
ncbi:hypothetical protein QFC20_003848 [Naganishia adeliensis]|uniref:Uncharacterized protein n=2 Tax=Naganishia adeliensis TaxID=92952 RepID=A0ACC2VJR0_9TREE|nr:hypothetical protein QFC20_005741 [Naganishia adeliensis]KAJ9106948.1 hypothetical protein QFC20_003848 [Naganishia adeliensis]